MKADEARTRFKNHWWRAYHGISNDSKLAVVALRADATKCEAGWVWICLLDFASQNENRGSTTGLDHEQIGVMDDISPEKVAAIMAAFVSRGMIQPDGTITAWEKRQPKRDRDDTDSAERVRRFREKQSHETPRNATVTPPEERRGEENRKETPIRIEVCDLLTSEKIQAAQKAIGAHRHRGDEPDAIITRKILQVLDTTEKLDAWLADIGRGLDPAEITGEGWALYLTDAQRWIENGCKRPKVPRLPKADLELKQRARDLVSRGKAASQENTCDPATWARIVAGRKPVAPLPDAA